MKPNRLLVVLLSLATLLPMTAFSGSPKKKSTPPPMIQSPTITAVTADSITVKQAQVTKTLTITQFTEIKVNGRKATVAELKPGMIVDVALGTDATKASRINATAK